MDEFKVHTKKTHTIQCELSPREVKALQALSLYGLDKLLHLYYENLGKVYLEPYEKDLRVVLKKFGKVILTDEMLEEK